MKETKCEAVRRELEELMLSDECSIGATQHLRDCGDCLLAIRAWKSSFSATQQQRAHLDRGRRGVPVSGEHVDRHMDASATRVLDRWNSAHSALAKSKKNFTQRISDLVALRASAHGQSIVAGV